MKEIRFAGFGGQGIIRSGIILGKAVSIFDNNFATMAQSFGPEARGGACSTTLLVSEEKILYPYTTEIDFLIAMSDEAYRKFKHELREDGVLIFESDLVKPTGKNKAFSIPATKFAEELGNRIFANVILLGFVTAVTDIVSIEAMRKAVPDSVPERFIDVNIKAFDMGYDYGKKMLAELGSNHGKTPG